MELINNTRFNLLVLQGYSGMCANCGVSLTYDENMIVIKYEEDYIKSVYVPLDLLTCPNCSKKIDKIIQWKSMNVTNEFLSLNKK